MDVEEALRLEEDVRGVGQRVADTGHAGDEVRAGAQVRLFAQELVCMAALGKGVGVAVGLAQNADEVLPWLVHLHLDDLLGCGALDQVAVDLEGVACATLEHMSEVVHVLVDYNLNVRVILGYSRIYFDFRALFWPIIVFQINNLFFS